MSILGSRGIMWVLHGVSLCLSTYGGKNKVSLKFVWLEYLNIWVTRHHMLCPNPKPSGSFPYTSPGKTRWIFMVITPTHHVLEDYLMSSWCQQPRTSLHSRLWLSSFQTFFFFLFWRPQIKFITSQLLQIPVWSQWAYLEHQSGAKGGKITQAWTGENKCPNENLFFLFLRPGGMLPGPERPKVPPIITVIVEPTPETAVQS